MTKVNDGKAFELFDLLCDSMKHKLKGGEVTASDLKVIVDFLKNNNINVDPSSNRVNDIIQELPFSEDIVQELSNR